MHTNYLEYIKREKNGALQAFLVKHINNWVARAYCDKVLEFIIIVRKLELTWEIVRDDYGVFGDKFVMEFYYSTRQKGLIYVKFIFRFFVSQLLLRIYLSL